MDSKYNIPRLNGKLSSKGFGVYKQLSLKVEKKKSLKEKLALTHPVRVATTTNGVKSPFSAFTPTNGVNGNGLTKHVSKAALLEEKNKNDLQADRRNLPVYRFRQRIVEEIKNNECLIFLGETGSGKTTQIPQFIHEFGNLLRHGICAITQPRRMAAISIATRVAKEQGSKLGDTVGYVVRFEHVASDKTKIQYMTDGTLLRQALNDRRLSAYSVIVLDEAHERTINTDVLFGLVKTAQRERKLKGLPLLRLVVMSATMDVDHFAKYFDGCNVIYLEGRLFPVNVLHVKKSNMDYQDTCLRTLFQIHKEELLSDDVLIFLTGQEEIELMAQTIQEILKSDAYKDYPMRVYPLYGALAQKKQMEVFNAVPQGMRKVILSTNIAETSITISRIKFVIDSGVVKETQFNPATGIESLKVCKISQAQAWQRTGRAGRESEGTCYRVYSIAEFEKMPRMTIPEICRSNLGATVLQLLALGIDCATFDFMDQPKPEIMESSFKLLHNLKAIDGAKTRNLTEIGKKMAKFPLDPRLSRTLMIANRYGCLEDVLSVVALVSGENVFTYSVEKKELATAAHQKFHSNLGDHVTLLNVFRGFRSANDPRVFCYTNFLNLRNLTYANEVRSQLQEICRKCGLTGVDKNGTECEDSDGLEVEEKRSKKDEEFESLRKCLLIGYFENVAQLQKDNSYMTLSSRQSAKIHPSSVLNGKRRPELLFYTDFVSTGKNYLKQNTVIEARWLLEMTQLKKHFRNFLSEK